MQNYKPMLPYLAICAAAFYLLPLVLREASLAMMLLLVLLPAVCLICGVLYGRKHGFQLMFAILVGILFVPTVWIYYNSSARFYIAAYTSFALAGNYFGSLAHKK